MSQPSRELEELLARARQEGVIESSGRFTVDLDTALRKLRSYQVANGHHYVKRLLRAAHWGEPQAVTIETSVSKARISFSRPLCRPQDLGTLFELFLSDEDPAARELATAANMALSLKPEKLEIQVADGQGGQLLVLKGERGELYDTSPGSLTTFQLTRTAGDTILNLGGIPEEYLEVSRGFRYSPLSIHLNGVRLERSWGAPATARFSSFSDELVTLRPAFFSRSVSVPTRHHVAELRVSHGRCELNRLGLGSSRASTWEDPHPGQCCFLAIGLCADEKRPSVAHFVYRGETLQSFPARLPFPATEVLVVADDLSLDIAGEKLNQDKKFQERWDLVKAVVGELSSTILRLYPQRARARIATDKTHAWVREFQLSEEVRSRLGQS